MKRLGWLACVLLALAMPCCAANSAGAEDLQAAADGGEPYVLLYILNNSDMRVADGQRRAANAYQLMLALLPDGYHYACIPANADATQPWVWRSRADTADFAAMDAQTAQEISKTATNAQSAETMAWAVNAAADLHDGYALTAVLLNAQCGGLSVKAWQSVAPNFVKADTVLRLPVYAYATPRDQNAGKDIAKALALPVATAPPASGQTGALYTLPKDSQATFDIALGDAQRILTDRMGLISTAAVATADGQGVTFAPEAMPDEDVADVRLLLLDVPAHATVRLETMAVGEPLAPVMVRAGSVKGLENRVYALPTPNGASPAPVRLILTVQDETAPAPTPTAVADTAAAAASDAPNVAADVSAAAAGDASNVATDVAPATADATPAAAADDAQPLPTGITARYFYRYAQPPETRLTLLDDALQKNRAFRVGIGFADAGLLDSHLRASAWREAFVRIEDEAGAVTEALAHYDTASGILSAEVMLTRAGTYTLQSGVRNTIGTRLETLGSEPLAVTVANAVPLPVEGTIDVDLLMDAPVTGLSESARVTMDVRKCFTDADNSADTLTYSVLSAMPETAADIGADNYFHVEQGLYSATLTKADGLLTIVSIVDRLPGLPVKKTLYLTAHDDEAAYGTVSINVRLHSVRLALEATALTEPAHGKMDEGQSDGAYTEWVSVRLPCDALPDAVRAYVRDKVEVFAGIVPVNEVGTATGDAPVMTRLTRDVEDSWSGVLQRPLINGTYRVRFEARLPDQSGGEPYQAASWHTESAEPITVVNAQPIPSPGEGRESFLLDRLEGMHRPEPFTLDVTSLFTCPDTAATLAYAVRVTDGEGGPVAAAALTDTDGRNTLLLVGCTDGYIREKQAAFPTRILTGITTDSAATGPSLPLGKAVAVEVGRIGRTVLHLTATNVDTVSPAYTVSVDTEDKRNRYLIWALMGLGAAGLLALLAAGVMRSFRKPYRNGLRMTLHDPAIGERQVLIGLPRWGKRDVRLDTLLLNGAMPCLPWLDGLEKHVRIRATHRGAMITLRRKALAHASLNGDTDDAGRRARLSETADTELFMGKSYQERIVFRLEEAVVAEQPRMDANAPAPPLHAQS